MISHSIRPWLVRVLLSVALLAPIPAGAQVWSPLAAPGGRSASDDYPQVAFDAANNRAIAYGGIPHSNDVWILEHVGGVGGAATWHRLSPIGAPPPARHAHGIAYDGASNRLIVFGGCAGGCFPTLNDVWILTNANGEGGTPEWIPVAPAGASPAGRAHAGVAYDRITNRLIVFGGQDGSAFGGATFPEVWVLTNANGLGGASSWQQLAPLNGPPPGQYGPTVSYDAASNRLTTFAGSAQGTGAWTNAVWVLENANGTGGTPIWSNLIPEGAPDAPPPLAFLRGARDDANNRLAVIGTSPDYVWVLDGANGLAGTAVWTQIVAAGAQPPAPIGLIAYSPIDNRMTVFEPSPDKVWVLGDVLDINLPPTADAGEDRTIEATSSTGALVRLDGSGSTDPEGDALTYTWRGPFGEMVGEVVTPALPLGSWVITLTVADGHGNTSTDSVAINVLDSTPPDVTLTVNAKTLWPPNGRLIGVTITADVHDAASAAACAIISVSSSEPPSPTEADWEITGPLTLSLRAAREGSGSGRIYSIGVTCTDQAGNATTGNVAVFVPHDRR